MYLLYVFNYNLLPKSKIVYPYYLHCIKQCENNVRDDNVLNIDRRVRYPRLLPSQALANQWPSCLAKRLSLSKEQEPLR